MIKKILLSDTGKYIFVKDLDNNVHTEFGFITGKDLKKKDGSSILTNTKKKLTIFSPSFIDKYSKLQRGAQIITPKDIGAIIANTGINSKSKVIDAGSGSGGNACFLANICKEVITYDIREDFSNVVKKNKENLGLKNLKIKNKDVYKGIDEKNVDLIVYDLPEPWNAIKSAENALKIGGFLVSYSPSILQVSEFVESLSKKFIHIKTIDVNERIWIVDGKRLRPETMNLSHTGFLTFARKIQ